MSSRPETIAFLLEQLADAGRVSSRAMFGEYAIYCNGKLGALLCDDTLYVKPTPTGRVHAGPLPEAPPYQGAKPCLVVPGDRWEDREWLSKLFEITAAELPEPKRRTAAKQRPRS